MSEHKELVKRLEERIRFDEMPGCRPVRNTDLLRDCLSALQGSTENRQKVGLLLDLHERLDDPEENVTAEELQTVLMMAAEALEKEQ
jgi:hypothetical protein